MAGYSDAVGEFLLALLYVFITRFLVAAHILSNVILKKNKIKTNNKKKHKIMNEYNK